MILLKQIEKDMTHVKSSNCAQISLTFARLVLCLSGFALYSLAQLLVAIDFGQFVLSNQRLIDSKF